MYINVISAVVYLDEGTSHVHLTFVPVIYAKVKRGNEINKNMQ